MMTMVIDYEKNNIGYYIVVENKSNEKMMVELLKWNYDGFISFLKHCGAFNFGSDYYFRTENEITKCIEKIMNIPTDSTKKLKRFSSKISFNYGENINGYFITTNSTNNDNDIAKLLNISFNKYEKLLMEYGASQSDSGYYFSNVNNCKKFIQYLKTIKGNIGKDREKSKDIVNKNLIIQLKIKTSKTRKITIIGDELDVF